MFRREGFAMVDVAAAAIRGAPLMRTWEGSIVAPDGIIVRNAMFLLEVKTKTRADHSRGGSRDADWIPGGQKFHCIDRANFLGYRRAQISFGRPLVVCVINIQDGLLLAATLRKLGDPYPSLQPQLYDVVNFPERRFAVLWEFDRRRLSTLFNEQPDKLNDARMHKVVNWLRPRQSEFDYFRRDLIDQLEDQWGRDLDE
jgi:hypothetical protein